MKQRILSLSVACGLALLAGASAAQGFKASNDNARAGMRVPAAAASAAAAPAAPRSADFIVAVVNSEPVTNVEVQQQVERLRAQAEASNMPADTLRRQALEMLIGQKIQLQMASERNLQVDNFAVQQAEESVARQNSMTMTELRARLVREGISETQFRADLKKQLVIQKLREAEVDSRSA